MISPTAIKLVLSAVVGAYIRIKVQNGKNLHDERMASLKAFSATEESRKRAALNKGKFVRRFIVLVCMSYAFIWPVLVAVFTDIPFIVMQEQQVMRLWGLLGSHTETFPIEVSGYIFLKVLIEDLIPMIGGFYFGSDAAKQ